MTSKNGEGKMKTKQISIFLIISLLLSTVPAVLAASNIAPTINSFTVTPISEEVGKPITFIATARDSDGQIASYYWDFGDGQTKTTSTGTTTHVYTKANNYLTQVVAYDDKGSSASDTEWVMIKQIGIAPYVSLQASANSGSAPLVVTFTAVAVDTDGSIAEYEWDFDGDGVIDKIVQSTSQTNVQVHTYATKGDRLATVIVKDNTNKAASDTEWIRVGQVAAANKPVVTITANPISGEAPLTVSFTGSATAVSGATVTSYAWDFNGDGRTDSTSKTASYTFSQAGNEKVTLSVADSKGNVGSADEWIMIKAPGKAPYVSLQESATSGTLPLTITFTAVAVDDDGTIASYE